MSRKRLLRSLAIVGVLALIASACSSGKKTDTGGTVKKGGTYRVQTDGFEWTGGFDPTGEYLGFAWMLYNNSLLRPLLGTNHLNAAKGGNDLLPDLAQAMPEVSADGLTYTFRLRHGVKFSPPVNREVHAQDVAYAIRRIASKDVIAQYPSYYDGVIEGFTIQDKKAGDIEIPGITTPDDYTLVIKLAKPQGDFLYRMGMAATAPMPEEVAKCFTKPNEYGGFLIASGPYMLEGTDKLDISTCAKLKKSGPVKGFDPTDHLIMVRNPNYDAATDDPDVRENNIDRYELTLNTNTKDIFDKIKAGNIEGESASPPAEVLQEYSGDAALKDCCLKAELGDRVWYITMNLIEPPFDDVHVRKAVNLIMNKKGLLQAWGGPIRGRIAEHIIPPEVLGGKGGVGEFDPYATPDHAGDLELAKAEMKQATKYDTDGDGLCDANACKNIQHVTRATPPYTDMVPIIEDSLKKIGLTLKSQPVQSFYGTAGIPSKRVPLSSGGGWGKDYADALTFFDPLLGSKAILPAGNVNLSMIGLTDEIAANVELKGSRPPVPSIDADSDACKPKSGEDRLTCWFDLDKKLMNEIVPWVPYLWATNVDIIGPAVSKYEFDQFPGEVGLAHVAVDTTKQKGL